MKNKYLIIALLFLGTGIAFSQTKPFEGKVTSTIQVGRGSKTESVEFYKNGNQVCDIAYMKTKMLYKDGISYTIDYSGVRPVVNVLSMSEESRKSLNKSSKITVGLEKTNKGKTYYKKFLSAYDAIKYVEENLEDGMVVNVRGNLKYSTYQDNTQVRKEITSIVLSSAERDKYAARFTQSILIDKDSTDLKALDKDKGVIYVNARVLDYVKEMNGLEIKGQYPFPKEFEYAFADISNGERCKKAYNGLFKVKKGVTMITFDGEFIESGATVTMTLADLPDDIQELVECGVFTEEEAIAKCTSNGSKERRMVLRSPYVKKVGEEKTPVLQKFEEKYSEDDLIFDFPDNNPEDELDEITPDDDLPFDFDNGDDDSKAESKADSSDGLDWLNDL